MMSTNRFSEIQTTFHVNLVNKDGDALRLRSGGAL